MISIVPKTGACTWNKSNETQALAWKEILNTAGQKEAKWSLLGILCGILVFYSWNKAAGTWNLHSCSPESNQPFAIFSPTQYFSINKNFQSAAPQAEGRRCTWLSTTSDYQPPQQILKTRAVGHWFPTNSFWQCFCHSWGKRTGPANAWIIFYYILPAWPAPLTAPSCPYKNHANHIRPSKNWLFFAKWQVKSSCVSIHKMPANCRDS